MAKRGPTMMFGPTKDAVRVLRMVKEWPKRTKAMQAQFSYDAAEEVKKGILSRLPSSPEFKEYREGLDVARVDMGAAGPAHVLQAKSKKKTLRKNDASSTLVYIQPKGKNKTVSDKVKMLARYSPWPMELLPFKPSKSDARVISRRVRPGEVIARTKRLDRRKTQWQAAAGAAGVRKRGKMGRIRAMPDLGFTALRAEFGLGGSKGAAHWRPSLLEYVYRTIPQRAKKKSKFDKAMSEPKNTEWLSWPTRSKNRLSKDDLKSFKGFQDKLGLKFRG